MISSDFAKAYGSIKREKLIDILMHNKISPNIIDLIAKVYTKDRTKIEVGGGDEVEI